MTSGGGKAAKRGYYIILKQGFNKQRPQDEAMQPHEEYGIIFA
jgi:hypothetical protein